MILKSKNHENLNLIHDKVQFYSFLGGLFRTLLPGPLKYFCALCRQILAKSAPQNHDKAKFATKLRKFSTDCVNVNNKALELVFQSLNDSQGEFDDFTPKNPRDLLDSQQKRVSPPVKCAASNISCVPPAMAAVAIKEADQG